MKMTKEVKALIAQYAAAHREIRTLRYTDYNLDVTVAFACADLINQMKHLPFRVAVESLKSEVEYEVEVLAKIKAQK
jgi:hypothetical protein